MSTIEPQQVHSASEPLLRFGLRQLLTMVALLSALCALLVKAPGYWPGVIAMGALLVGAHIFGNVVGTRLRNTSPKRETHDPTQAISASQPKARWQESMPETTPLALHAAVVRWGRVVSGVGVLAGVLLGGWALSMALGSEVTWPGLGLGAVSCGVLGGWIAFMAYSFGSISRHAWMHAKQTDHTSQRKL
ncbi:hypothetical protein [Adhaeretor mobilis]|uniref:Transmembrane protein n=1 Tax=Adhaeretor mobilis TaxID=1930276 RepID=A0A517MXV6_9BACT|nr:hypothetical protein [Adhaeretor mobilis]QDS99703.1 hypothetical protein HG15A2_30300 [Adhaeretor mobilis]